MKKIYSLAALMLTMFAANAQVRFGFKAGYNLTGVKMEASRFSYTSGLRYHNVSGFHAGAMADISFGGYFFIQPSLFYTMRGFDADGYVPGPADGPIDAKIKTRYYYLELPLHVVYKYTLGPGKLFAGAGPFLSYGVEGRISGVYNDSHYYTDYTFHRNLIFLDKEASYYTAYGNKQYLRPFNIGAGFTMGYEFDAGILVSANYDLGLTDVEPSPYLSQKSRSWGISVGYLFNNGN